MMTLGADTNFIAAKGFITVHKTLEAELVWIMKLMEGLLYLEDGILYIKKTRPADIMLFARVTKGF